MVAVQAFIDRAEAHAEVRNRAHLKIVPLFPEDLEIPDEVRSAVNAIYQKIEDRTLKPVIEASTLEEANKRAISGFEMFIDLWPTVITTLLPWLQEHPNQFGILKAARDMWKSEEALRLGEDACEWFAAAQSARQALADVVAPGPGLEGIVWHTLLADFAFMLGILLMRTPDAKPAEGLTLSIAKLAHASATNAFAIATMHRFADQAP